MKNDHMKTLFVFIFFIPRLRVRLVIVARPDPAPGVAPWLHLVIWQPGARLIHNIIITGGWWPALVLTW